MDGDNERAIMKNLVAELESKTIVFVTHRAATLNYVDRVLLLQDGELLAFDTVENLQNQFENFRSLFNLSAAP